MLIFVVLCWIDSATCALKPTRSYAETVTFSSRCFSWWWTLVCRKSRVSRTWNICGKLLCHTSLRRTRPISSKESSKRHCTMDGKPAQTMFSICSVLVAIEFFEVLWCLIINILSTLENCWTFILFNCVITIQKLSHCKQYISSPLQKLSWLNCTF